MQSFLSEKKKKKEQSHHKRFCINSYRLCAHLKKFCNNHISIWSQIFTLITEEFALDAKGTILTAKDCTYH